jgi:two-component system sensor histidine kinase ResE
VIGDSDRLKQVFTNLVDNGIQFTPPGGTVRIKAWHRDEAILIEFQDNGVGIDAGDISRIFERFYQVDSARAGGKDRGTGLGLPIAREIIHAHGGSITVESKPGQGSNFMVKIPVADS